MAPRPTGPAWVIGVDLGTSSTKALLLDGLARVVAQVERPTATNYPAPGWVEQDPEAMVDNVVGCVRDLLRETDLEPDAVAGLGIDNHTESLVLWNRSSGRAVHPAIIWQCRRSAEQADDLATGESRRLIRRRTGLELDPTFTATKLAWVSRHRPDIAEGLRTGDILWGTVDSWLVWRLTGGECYATDYSNASRTMLLDIAELKWSPELAKLFELELSCCPALRPSTGAFGKCRPEFLGAELPITGVLGDQQAALFGQGCLEPGELKCTYGTGAFVWMNAGQFQPGSEIGEYLHTLAWYFGQPTYALEGFVMYAGACLDWLVEHLGLCENVIDVVNFASESGGSRDVKLVPAFQGLGSPWWSPQARAAILDLSADSDTGAVCHAALESVCFQVRRVLEAMSSDTVTPSGALRVDGGLTRSKYFLQLQADILGMPLEAVDMEHVTPYGSALVAGMGAGLWSADTATGIPRPAGVRYVPRLARRQEWTDRYRDWCSAVDHVVARSRT